MKTLPNDSTVRVLTIKRGYPYRTLLVHKYNSSRGYPPGWAIPGGTVEPADQRATAIQTALCCARREMQGETGYTEFDLHPFLPGTAELAITAHRSDHLIVLVWAEILGDEQIPRAESEELEIDKNMWVDIRESPARFFGGDEDLPYFTHVRDLVRVILSFEGVSSSAIHPLWKLALPVGEGDGRFPPHGYSLKPHEWKDVLKRISMAKNDQDIDLDYIYHSFGDQWRTGRFSRKKTYKELEEDNLKDWQRWAEQWLAPLIA